MIYEAGHAAVGRVLDELEVRRHRAVVRLREQRQRPPQALDEGEGLEPGEPGQHPADASLAVEERRAVFPRRAERPGDARAEFLERRDALRALDVVRADELDDEQHRLDAGGGQLMDGGT